MIFVGVDTGSSAVKAVAIKKNKKSFDILRTHFFPLQEENKKAQTLSHLKSLKKLYPERDTQYIFCLPQNEVSTELIRFPFKERYKIIKSLPYQLENRLSLFDYENMISDIKMAGFSEGTRDVLVFSGFKQNIANVLKDLHATDIKPVILTCEASAVANLFESPQENKSSLSPAEGEKAEKEAEPTPAHMYLKIGHTHTMALIWAGGQVKKVYSFEWGTASCVRKIALKYEIPFQKALQKFCEKAFVITHTDGYTGSQIAFSRAIQEGFTHLIDKIRLLLLQLEGENIYSCKKIFICGGGAQVRNLQAFFSFHLNIPVSRVDKPTGVPLWDLRNNQDKQNNFITALGTALEGLKKPKNPAVNFLKGEFAIKWNPFSILFSKWRRPLLWGATALVLLSFYSALRNHQTQKWADKTHEIFQKQSARLMKLNRKKVHPDRVKTFIESKKAEARQTELTQVLSKVPSALDTLKNLSSSIKKQESWNLEIQTLNIEGNRIEIQGTVDRQSFALLKKNLMDISVRGSLKQIQPQLLNKEVQAKGPEVSNEEVTNKEVTNKENKKSSSLTTKKPQPGQKPDQAPDQRPDEDIVSKTTPPEPSQMFKYSFIQKQG